MQTLEEPQSTATGYHLPVMEHFHTIQGEGSNVGRAAYFIRLGGCDVGCVWCDVKDSWDAEKHPLTDVRELVKLAKDSGAPLVVITGGEPCMYNLEPLTALLEEAGLQTCLETSGAYPLTGNWHWICFSPKKFKAPLASFYAKAHELKVVVFNRHDLAWAETHAEQMHADAQLLLQPEWDKREAMMPLLVDYVKAHPQWRISLQTHKYLNVP